MLFITKMIRMIMNAQDLHKHDIKIISVKISFSCFYQTTIYLICCQKIGQFLLFQCSQKHWKVTQAYFVCLISLLLIFVLFPNVRLKTQKFRPLTEAIFLKYFSEWSSGNYSKKGKGTKQYTRGIQNVYKQQQAVL